MELDEIRDYYYEWIHAIPAFLEPKDPSYNIMKEYIYNAAVVIMQLIEDKQLSDRKILKINSEFDLICNDFLGYHLHIYKYFNDVILDLINICEKFQYFESCYNLNKFYKMNFSI